MQVLRDLFERAMLATSRFSVDEALKESNALIERLQRTQTALRARAERYQSMSDRYENRAAVDHTHADRAAKVIAKLEDIFGA